MASGKDISVTDACSYLSQVGLCARDYINREVNASLSGGETQKLAIARLFAKQFDVAVLDEPSSALDPVAESKMYDALAEGTKDKTVLYISHRLSSAANADNILVFRDGQLIETGNHAELMEKGGEYCEMFTLQASGYREEESQDEAE